MVFHHTSIPLVKCRETTATTGRIIERVFELRKEVLVLLLEDDTDSALLVVDEICLEKLINLTDSFNLFNLLNL